MRFFNAKEKNGLLAFRHRVTSSFSIKFTRHGGKDTKLAVDGSGKKFYPSSQHFLSEFCLLAEAGEPT